MEVKAIEKYVFTFERLDLSTLTQILTIFLNSNDHLADYLIEFAKNLLKEIDQVRAAVRD